MAVKFRKADPANERRALEHTWDFSDCTLAEVYDLATRHLNEERRQQWAQETDALKKVSAKKWNGTVNVRKILDKERRVADPAVQIQRDLEKIAKNNNMTVAELIKLQKAA